MADRVDRYLCQLLLLGLVQRFASGCEASSRGLIGENTPHDEPSPARTIKRISLLSSWAPLLFCYLGLHALNAEFAQKVDNFFLDPFLFFLDLVSNRRECA